MAFNPALHPRGPNGRFTRSYARQMSALDGVKAKKAKAGFRAKVLKGAEDARNYLRGLSGVKSGKNGGGGIKQHLDSGALGRANETLRAGKTGPEVQVIDKEMRPLPDGLDLYRSVPAKKFGNVDPKSLNGMLVSDAGYFPTTVAPTRAVPGNVQMHIKAPAGTPAAVDPDSGQVVLGHGAQLAVDSVDVTPGGSTRMDLVVLPDADGGAPDPPSAPTPDATPNAPDGATAEQATPEARPFGRRVAEAQSNEQALAATPLNLLDPDGPPAMTREQERGLDSYQSEDYRGINHILRGGDEARLADFYLTPEGVQQTIAAVDSAMEQSRLADEIVTLRGIRNAEMIFGDRVGGDLSGMEWNEDAYVSTTTDEDVAYGFIQRSAGQPVIMRMVVPPPTGAIQLSDDTYESEVMLQRGLRMRVVADNGVNEDGVRMLDIEVLPNEPV